MLLYITQYNNISWKPHDDHDSSYYPHKQGRPLRALCDA